MAGPVALVTGAARGIGAAIAARLARDGWRVVLVDRDPAGAETARRLGGRFAAADVGVEADVLRAVNTVRAHEGRLDALVCNAGYGITKTLAALTLLEWNAVLALALCAAAPGSRAMDRFEGRAIVTGTGPASLAAALPVAFADVLVKVSGNPALAADPAVAAIDPAPLVEDYVFLDRLTDIPRHDEQGSRDRPWDLDAHFAPDGVRATLARLGSRAWEGPRPRLLARIAVRARDGSRFPLSADADDDEPQRQALLAAADRYGMRVALPPRATPEMDMPGTVVLAGTLTWSDADFGWVGAWRMAWEGQPHAWRIVGVSFDAAFRNAVAGAMAVAAGYGER